MEEELKKRNTDCVYFLASPFTCKKGVDCEYRHNEMARLNPRDCWYWMAGNCFNPMCGFRHPPFDANMEKSSVSLPLNKTSVPCYFYYNSHCSKGDKCSFLHNPNECSGKPVKAEPAFANPNPLESKTYVGNCTGATPVDIHHNHSDIVLEAVGATIKPKGYLQEPVPFKKSASPLNSSSKSDEPVDLRSALLPIEDNISTGCDLLESSEEQGSDQIAPEYRFESPPRCGVLMDDSTGLSEYEKDPEYLETVDSEHSYFLGDDFEDPIDHNSNHSETELLYESRLYESCETLGQKHTFRKVRVLRPSRKTIMDSAVSLKRKYFSRNMLNDQNVVKSRDPLRRRRLVDGCVISHSSRRHHPPPLIRRKRESFAEHGTGDRLRGRFGSEVEMLKRTSYERGKTSSYGFKQRHRPRFSHENQSRQHYNGNRPAKWQSFSPQVSRKLFSEEKSTQECAVFTRPKTLAQIKGGKRKVEGNGQRSAKMADPSRTLDFEGPKSLSEILKDKKKLVADSTISF